MTEDVREGPSWDMIYTEDEVLSKEYLQHSLTKWRMGLESRWEKITRKRQYMMYTDQEQERQNSFRMSEVEMKSVTLLFSII